MAMASLRFPHLAAYAAALLLILGACSSGDESSKDSGANGTPAGAPEDDASNDAGSKDESSSDPAENDPQDDETSDQKPEEDQDPQDDQDPEPGSGDEGSGDEGSGGEGTGDEGGDENAGPVEPDVAMPEPVGDAAIDRMIAFIREQEIDRSRLNWRHTLPKPPELEFEADKVYDWILHTNLGDMRFRLRPQGTPMHVSSAIYLTKLGYYDGLGFHRVITGFMAQGGCPDGTGSGGPGYTLDGEYPEGVTHARRGDLSAANSGTKADGSGTDGSQFFVCFAPQPGLNGRHTVWGGLVEGFDTLDKIQKLAAPTEPGTPKEPITIESAEIVVR